VLLGLTFAAVVVVGIVGTDEQGAKVVRWGLFLFEYGFLRETRLPGVLHKLPELNLIY